MSNKIFRSFFVLVVVIGFVVLVQAPRPVHAAGPWYVTPTGDNSNDCLGPTTPCATINGAIEKASSGDVIYIAQGTYIGTGDEVVLIDKNIILSGGWEASFANQSGMSTINGEGIRRGITVPSSEISTLVRRFIIENGFTNTSNGGGIHNQGTLTLLESTVQNNSAEVYGSDAGGGGIYTSGTMMLNQSTITNNEAIVNRGGGILAFGNLTVENSTISGNSAQWYGGGIYSDGSLQLTDSTISNNQVDNFGGGIATFSGSIVINRSVIKGNTVGANGAGLFISGGTVSINNSTLSGNIASSTGGGIAIYVGNASVNNSTITGNVAMHSLALLDEGGGITAPNYTGVITLQNTIVAGNSNPRTPDCAGTIYSAGYNIIGDTSDCTFSATTGDQVGTSASPIDPLLGPLQDNSGPTFSHALLPGSPAIDAGNPAGCTDHDGVLLAIDQRGVARPQGTGCDIGAFELDMANPIIDLSIDIKPGSEVDPINAKSKGKIPVAILSTAEFDAPLMVDKTSLTFGRTGDETSLAFCNNGMEDVNDDGLQDQVCHFYTQGTGFQVGDIEGILEGLTIEGVPIEGHGAVNILK